MSQGATDGPDLRALEHVEYDVLAEREGRFTRVRTALASVEEAREEVAWAAPVNPSLTYHLLVRTTTTHEQLADDLL